MSTLTEQQKDRCKEILGVPFDYNLDYYFNNFEVHHDNRIIEIIAAWEKVALKASELDIEGYKSKKLLEQRNLRNKLSRFFGMNILNIGCLRG